MSAESPLVYLAVEVDRKGDLSIVHCRGKLIAGVCGTLYQKVHGLMPESKQIVIDLSDLEWIDSMGVGTLVRIHAGCRYADCHLRLVNMGKRVQELLALTGLLGVFAGTGHSTAETK